MLIVQKFGGTSVGNIERIKDVARKVARTRDDGHQVVVVLSAMSGETDRLRSGAPESKKSGRCYDEINASGSEVFVEDGTKLIDMLVHK